ncbi:MAG: D-alanine--D-alanine ligase [Alphaproteobacteria bacterium]|jgi:D-alanine-D-alanine ligase|nr:D-alanine--D-alanine ligase [Alphaproteobacteria bacterium]
MQKVVVLMGGISSEKEISLKTGQAIYEALESSQDFSVEKYVLTEDIFAFINFLNNNQGIIIFNALHGKFGEDGRIQAVLDLMKIPYTHSGVLTSAVAMNKILTKEIAKSIGIPTAKHQAFNPKNFKASDINISYPLVVKPIDEGSSVGIYLVNNQAELEISLNQMQNFSKVMIEEYISGVELTVGVLNDSPIAITEIVPINAFYDYESKYAAGGSKHIIPANLPSDITEKIKQYARILCNTIGCRGAARVDFIYNKNTNTPYLLELNNQPGMTATSLLPEQAQYLGISFAELCAKLISLARYDD